MVGRLEDMSRRRDGQWLITFSTAEDFSETFDELADKDVNVEIKRAFKRRSLDANRYCWKLVSLIAEKTGERRSDVYRHAIREIGGVSDIVCVLDRAVDRLRKSWELNGLGWQTETLKSKTPGCTNVVLYYGSSVYDSKQMAQLIDSLIQDAEALGIPTITEAEQKKMIGYWGKQKTTKNEREG